ncbi:MAG: ATP-binding protein, partial [Prolixibacteraceae bacterium]
IIERWIEKLKDEIPGIAKHKKTAIENSIPDLLDAIIIQLDKKVKDKVIFNSKKHGLVRASYKEYSLRHIVREYNLLKQTILEEFKDQRNYSIEDRETVTKALDQCIEQAAESYFLVKENIQVDARKIAERKANELQLTDKHREEFINSISHDLNNPLANIKTCVSLIEDGLEIEKAGSVLSMIKKSTAQAESLINDFLSTDKINYEEELPVEKVIVDVLDDLSKETNIYRFTEERDFHLQSDSDEILFNCDITLVRRAYHNLLNNALKYGEKNSRITITCNKKDDGLEISVHNYGKSLSSAAMKNIFDRYYQIEESSKGWGIGLAFVKKVAQAHGGTITVDSNEKEGTTFRLHIPAT